MVKKLLFHYDWKIEKIYVQKEALGGPTFWNRNNMLRNCNGIMDFEAYRCQEAEICEWFRKKVIWKKQTLKFFKI